MTSRTAPLIVGAGIAGLWAAWRLSVEGRRSVVFTKGALADSASAWAQGGIAVALSPGDSPAEHAADTLAAGRGLSDPEAVRVLTTEGPDRIRELLALGAQFDVGADGRLRFGLEAAHRRPRIIHAGGDRTGAVLVSTLVEIIRRAPEVEIVEYAEVRDLLEADGRVAGVRIVHADSRIEERWGPAVVLATGGVGQLFETTTNPLVATGDGWALAYHIGAELRDLEFLQFHPTALRLAGLNPAPLISEAVRGAGALLVDGNGDRFVLKHDSRGELAPRDVLARAVASAEGGVWLDARVVPGFAEAFPGITAMLASHGLDPTRDLLPVAPALHYAMGGISTDLDGRTTRTGLWAIGEVASTGVHGANRLASNSLLEGLVFADRLAREILTDPEVKLAIEERRTPGTDDPGPDRAAHPIRAAMRQVMSAHVGVVRTEGGLQEAERELLRLKSETPRKAWRTANQLLVSRLITRAALERRGSVGGHSRADFPEPIPTTEEV